MPTETLRTAFSPAPDKGAAAVERAQSFSRRLALGHYENFSVVSVVLPKRLRQDFCNVYAFCRVADDAGDETGNDKALSKRLLAQLHEDTVAAYRGEVRSVLFAGLMETVRKHDIPMQPFLDLISAFEQDQDKNRYDTFEELVDYCRRSADPVGRIVLYLAGFRDEVRQELSDLTCTALQLTNFWQDVRRDLDNLNRIYVPHETMKRFGVSENVFLSRQPTPQFCEMMKFEVDRAERMFVEGEKLWPLLPPDIRPQIELFNRGGRAVLGEIRRIGYDTLSGRPVLSKRAKATLVARALLGRMGSILKRSG